jgi:hypothetical protein
MIRLFFVASSGLLLIAITNPAYATDMKVVENQAKMEFHGHDLLLNHPFVKNKLHFNAAGALVGESEEGTWTMNGIIHVEDVDVKPNLVRVHGAREILTLRTEGGVLGLQPIFLDKHAEVEIEAAGAIATLEDVKQTIGLVFHQENLVKKLNEYWTSEVKVTAVDPKTGHLTWEGVHDGIYGYLGEHRPVYIPDSKYIPTSRMESPKPIHKEELGYTRSAATNRTQGKTYILIVVNERGFPEIMHLVKDLGDDLDMQSLGSMSQWRFKPATKDGQPVACVIYSKWTYTSY